MDGGSPFHKDQSVETSLHPFFFNKSNNLPLTVYIDNVRVGMTPAVAGDYNGNGTVDAADYVLWRNGGPLINEVADPGTVSAADYTAWRARFGNTSGSGSSLSVVPAPRSELLLFAAGACWLGTKSRRTVINHKENAN